MDPNSPFGPPPDEDPMLYLKAAQRKADLEHGYPVADGKGGSRFIQPPPSNQLLELLSRFLRPGGQTAPATPKFNMEGVEDEVIQK